VFGMSASTARGAGQGGVRVAPDDDLPSDFRDVAIASLNSQMSDYAAALCWIECKPLTYSTQSAIHQGVHFEWDSRKSAANEKKHGVTFAEAQRLFESGEDYLEIFDESHSADEERFIAIGPITRGIALVVWTERSEDVVRIISARLATKSESALYRRYMRGRR
jgi:uncharacterized protein